MRPKRGFAIALFVILARPALSFADGQIHSLVQIDQLEYGFDNKGANAIRFNGFGWVGGDFNRFWFNTQGTQVDKGPLEDADVQALYGRLVAPFWDLLTGLRYFDPRASEPSRGSAVLGIQGLAPYWFEVQAFSFISSKGDVSGRLEVEYELLLTQRWVLEPRMETNVAVQDVKDMGVGSGFNDLELGLRLRYEIRRELAPYIGVSSDRQYGETASLARDRGEDPHSLRLVLGIRASF